MSFGQLLGAGTLAGLAQMSITCARVLLLLRLCAYVRRADPIETVRTRLTLSKDLARMPYRGILDCFVQTVRLEGPTALYKGFGISLLSGAPYVGIQVGCSFVLLVCSDWCARR